MNSAVAGPFSAVLSVPYATTCLIHSGPWVAANRRYRADVRVLSGVQILPSTDAVTRYGALSPAGCWSEALLSGVRAPRSTSSFCLPGKKLRLLVGSDAYTYGREMWQHRVETDEKYETLSRSTDADGTDGTWQAQRGSSLPDQIT